MPPPPLAIAVPLPHPAAMPRLSLADEIRAVQAVCRDLGLGAVVPELLAAAHHSSFRVAPPGVVARVQSGEAVDDAMTRARREVAVAGHAARGAPALAPLAALAGPHRHGTAVVTLWPCLAGARAADDADAAVAATTLAAVHRALADFAGALPPFTAGLDRCGALLADAALPALDPGDRALLQHHFARLRQAVTAAPAPWRPLHGDVHLGNLLLGPGGPAWTDFEDACTGPVEVDIAGLPAEVWPAFAAADPALVRRCADLRSVTVATWCWAEPDRSAAHREAAEYHLASVRGWSR